MAVIGSNLNDYLVSRLLAEAGNGIDLSDFYGRPVWEFVVSDRIVRAEKDNDGNYTVVYTRKVR